MKIKLTDPMGIENSFSVQHRTDLVHIQFCCQKINPMTVKLAETKTWKIFQNRLTLIS